MTLAERLLARSIRNPETGCLRWTGDVNNSGYGRISVRGRLKGVHRVAHEVWIGPIPDGYQVDHIRAAGCRFRDCIEPAHLEAVTPAENVARIGRQPAARCAAGHEMSGDNVRPYTTPEGYVGRKCRQCERGWRAKGRARRAACPHCGRTRSVHNLPRHIASCTKETRDA